MQLAPPRPSSRIDEVLEAWVRDQLTTQDIFIPATSELTTKEVIDTQTITNIVFNEKKCPCRYRKLSGLNVLDYNWKEAYRPFKDNRNDNILLGLEIEIEFPAGDESYPRDLLWSDYVKENLKNLTKEEWLFFKRDGSINRGLEIVTHPLGWEWIKKNQNKINLFEELIEKGFSSKATTTCGLHIHIDKSIFKTLHLSKFILFHYDNLPFINIISERGWNSMSRWAHFEFNRIQILREIQGKWGRDRHQLINLNNPETVELRYFRGALDKFSIMKAIQFVVSLYNYTKEVSLKDF